MTISTDESGMRIESDGFTADSLVVRLADGRSVSVPLAWYPRLLRASSAQLANWRLSGGGYGIHWPDLDEDLSAEGILRGAAAPPRSVRGRA